MLLPGTRNSRDLQTTGGVDNTHRPQDVEEYDQPERLSRWMYEFQKCIKCYGCRNICPVCFCRECSLEHKELVGTGALPPEVPVFHLVRAVHMAGRCIDCGLCEDACPVDIPLRLLYRKVNEIVVNVFDYETGSSADQSPFSILGDKVDPGAETDAVSKEWKQASIPLYCHSARKTKNLVTVYIL